MSLASLLARLNGGASVPAIEHHAFTRAVADKSRAIVDVREPHEYAAGHIPCAINLPLSSFTPW
jgi:rhodanese-related sulfurtransferase